MAASAFTVRVKPQGGAKDSGDHQASPAWVLTFVRWENRDTKNYKSVDAQSVREPMVVVNDCIQVTTGQSKGVLTPQMTAILKGTDVNYETAVHPGDFVFVNMLNWPGQVADVAARAAKGQQINRPGDGFKGFFKVQSVRRTLANDMSTGTKTVVYRIQGFAFTEFNNAIYFNPHLVDASERNNDQLFITRIGGEWLNVVSKKGINNVRDVLRALIEAFIGSGITKEGRMSKDNLMRSPNTHFYVPSKVGAMLGVPAAKSAKDLYLYLMGVQQYSGGSTQNMAAGLNPQGVSLKSGRFYYTPTNMDGFIYLKAEYWNCQKLWGIMQQHLHAPINEMYTCFRTSPQGDVMPTVVARQMPFTSEHFKGSKRTKFLNLPRWSIDPAMIEQLDLGREEAARINFVQVFGRSLSTAPGFDIAEQTARGNYYFDADDVKRSGLRPYILSTEFDEVDNLKDGAYRSQYWASLLGDAMGNGHLRLNGTVELVGVVDPIAPGDNAEIEGVVYHIEEVTHSAGIDPHSGKKFFKTRLALSHGVDPRSTEAGPLYSEMEFTGAYPQRKDDYEKLNKVLPGVSESQDVPYRPGVEPTDKDKTRNQSFTPNSLRPKKGAK